MTDYNDGIIPEPCPRLDYGLWRRPVEALSSDGVKELRRLQSENAKLRKLCAGVWHLFTEYGAVQPCDLPVVDAVRDRMRELGIEVTS